MYKELKELIETTNSSYQVFFEESSMMNIRVDELNADDSFAYIEEYTQGQYNQSKFGKKKSMRVQIYFCKFSELYSNALERQCARTKIEKEIVEPFMDNYNQLGIFKKAETFTVRYPLVRFDANEVSVMLEFDCIENVC